MLAVSSWGYYWESYMNIHVQFLYEFNYADIFISLFNFYNFLTNHKLYRIHKNLFS